MTSAPEPDQRHQRLPADAHRRRAVVACGRRATDRAARSRSVSIAASVVGICRAAKKRFAGVDAANVAPPARDAMKRTPLLAIVRAVAAREPVEAHRVAARSRPSRRASSRAIVSVWPGVAATMPSTLSPTPQCASAVPRAERGRPTSAAALSPARRGRARCRSASSKARRRSARRRAQSPSGASTPLRPARSQSTIAASERRRRRRTTSRCAAREEVAALPGEQRPERHDAAAAAPSAARRSG